MHLVLLLALQGPPPEGGAPLEGAPPETQSPTETPEAESDPATPGIVELEPEPAPVFEPPPPPVVEEEGPPFHTEADTKALRERYRVPTVQSTPRAGKWRCLLPDPACGFQVEIVATSAYTFRVRQGDVSEEGDVATWHSGRVGYDLWLDIPVLDEVAGNHKWTRMTFGPKGGVILSDSHDLWGNAGFAMRYWFGHGKWAPALEMTTALSFKLRGDRGGEVGPQRSPIGLSADVGVSLGGFGAIVVGGQYDSPLAREDIPEKFRISAAGQVFVGFRGNILWGAPAVMSVTTHGLTQRHVTAP